jgi:hypothetical protein
MGFVVVFGLLAVGGTGSSGWRVTPVGDGSIVVPADAEHQPDPASGDGVADPPSSTLHDDNCAGQQWQLLSGLVQFPHAAPAMGDSVELDRCVERYAGWVTNDGDDAGVSRAMMYAALAATGECAEGHDWDGALMSGDQCSAANHGMDATACLAQMKSSRAFGIATLAATLKAGGTDVPLVAGKLATGAVTCGGGDGWKIAAPAGFVDHFVGAYNTFAARKNPPHACSKRIIVSFALYTGLGKPGGNGVAEANGCWVYERVAKDNPEWKICGYDGSVHNPGGDRWAYDDTNGAHDAGTESSRITSCRSGAPVAGYVYMANRGDGWHFVTSTGVRSHFAEIYSGQTAIDDQFSAWKGAGEPGAPMVNFGEATTTASQITTATNRACAEVPGQDWFGVYVYPQTLDGDRLSALVKALNSCTQ